MNEVTIVRPETAAMSADLMAIIEEANSIVITDQASLDLMGVVLVRIKTFRKLVAAKFKTPIANADETHKSMLALRNDLDHAAKYAEQIGKDKVSAFTIEQGRIQREEQDRLREVARKEAEDRQIAEAERLEKDGHKEAAEEVLSAPPLPMDPIAVVAIPKARGVSVKMTYEPEVFDESLVTRKFLMVDMPKLQKYGRAMGSQAVEPGVEFIQKPIVAVRAKT